ncbi:peptidylprolyl isomerase domain and WD repeat-containing protein 1 [Frankliniella occidentalis]|uniref:peptidylprolyl isomerase n=1 Tax=Frankliniella occidentalis TaxID=133901 RepID=A0A6J1SEF3_FRAOC|nr:peptidylprolyl isomerase domain and WD repeat-containing protein 1 [Frankliniella occidentalis]
MAEASSSGEPSKRPKMDDNDDENDNDEWVGPLPSEAAQPKRKKILQYEKLYLENLPCSEVYEKSFMHRDVITHVIVTKTEFVITASCDGHIKFWKKQPDSIEFVKHFRSHLAPVLDVATNANGSLFLSCGADKALKIFDVINFDMINMIKLNFMPNRAEWIHSPGDAINALAVSEADSSKIYIFDGQGKSTPLHVLEKLHTQPVVCMKYNAALSIVVSADKTGIVEYWTGPKSDYKFPKNVLFDSKLDTDLFDFIKNKTYPTSIAFPPEGNKMAILSADRKIRIFNFLTGKLTRIYDESLSTFTQLHQTKQQLPNMEFNRRMATERELEKADPPMFGNILYDESGHFILYTTMLGIKLVNTYNNRCIMFIGKSENLRPLHIGLFQGRARRTKAAVTVELEASENPTLDNVQSDPTLFCTAHKKNRFYLFTRNAPDDTKSHDNERDVFNERPSKDDIIAATEATGLQKVYETAIVHTAMGDIHIKLFLDCPKAVENFCVHSKNGYFNGHIFHRVIKGFMVQTGDPTGTGTGGESIWGGEFEDEFRPNLRHDRPYTVSMANAGPNTNGSQFFISVIPTPWLDNKHTVFGRVVKGMEVVQNISNVKTNPKTDKPYDDVQIISVTVK